MKITRNLMAFAIALIVMLSISFISSAWSPATMASQTSQSFKSALSDPVVPVSFEKVNRATVNVPQNSFQTIAITEQSSGFITKEAEQFQINYPNFTVNNSNKLIEQPPELNSKFEIIPNWRTCKSDPYQYFTNDYKPELVWRE